jgi:hypothetical protein
MSYQAAQGTGSSDLDRQLRRAAPAVPRARRDVLGSEPARASWSSPECRRHKGPFSDRTARPSVAGGSCPQVGGSCPPGTARTTGRSRGLRRRQELLAVVQNHSGPERTDLGHPVPGTSNENEPDTRTPDQLVFGDTRAQHERRPVDISPQGTACRPREIRRLEPGSQRVA